ncbi:GAF domain-containing protein [Lysobacter firmicutimachus]|uniref:GAF domain-containing protein n=1 Tax=Lysobacter firmicutimachus TaxID=1792846 RepID=A0ABU8D3C6_9GAMM
MEYLRNMGVGASMSISLIVDGRLWGLIACHHPQPRPVDAAQRIAADVFGRYVSLLLSSRDLKRVGAAESASRAHRVRLEQALSDGTPALRTLRDEAGALLGASCAHGLALVAGDQQVLGECVDEAAVEAALAWARANAGHEAAGSADRTAWNPSGEGPAGLFAVPLEGGTLGWLLLFREEQIEHVRWAGAPSDAYQLDAGSLKIGPRASFQEWNQTVRGTSEPWTGEDAERAERLRLLLLRYLHAPASEPAERDTGGRLVRLDAYGHRRRLTLLANLLADAADHLDPQQRERMSGLIGELEAIVSTPANLGERQAAG